MLPPRWIISYSSATKSALLKTGLGKRRGTADGPQSFSRRHTSVEALKQLTFAQNIFPAIAEGFCNECNYFQAAAEAVRVRYVCLSRLPECDVGVTKRLSR